MRPHCTRRPFRTFLVISLIAWLAGGTPVSAAYNKAAKDYLRLLENFAGWAEQHWNEQEQCYDAQGAGVTWARGNGDVCIAYAVLLTEYPKKATISPRKIPRAVMLDHVRRTIRTLCLRNRNCKDPQAQKPTWGGPDWQSALETEHWVFATHLLDKELDADTKALVRQVATAEANATMKTIPSAKRGNTAADDCSWNAGFMGIAAAFYDDDPRAREWDEWAKRWALNTDAREADRKSTRMVDGKPLGEWLVSVNVNADLTLENHGFWDIPYQVSFAEFIGPSLAYHLAGKKIPEAFEFNSREESENILKWLVLPDGDLLCPQGIDWAERDVQHSWVFVKLGTMLDMPWARAAEQRCLKLLTQRQAKFGDGALHANDFGYETDLARMWACSFLAHKYFGKKDGADIFPEQSGTKIFPYVSAAVHRTPELVSSVTWFRGRQLIMIVPNDLKALGDYPSFTAYRFDAGKKQFSGTGYLKLVDDKKVRECRVDGEPVITDTKDGYPTDGLWVSFTRTIPKVATQKVGYWALNDGRVLVFSQWRALADLNVAEVVDHPFYWVQIKGYSPERKVKSVGKDAWSIDGKLQMHVFGGAGGKIESDGLLGSVRTGPFSVKAGEIIEDTVCVYQPIVSSRPPRPVNGNLKELNLGNMIIRPIEDRSVRPEDLLLRDSR